MLPSLAGLVLAAALSMGDPFTYEYAGQTDASGKAHIIIVANESFDSLDVTIKGDGQTITKSLSMACAAALSRANGTRCVTPCWSRYSPYHFLERTDLAFAPSAPFVTRRPSAST